MSSSTSPGRWTPRSQALHATTQKRGNFRINGGTIWDGRTLHELYAEAYTPWEWQPKLKQVANDLGLDLFSTPFDPTAVDFLEEMNVPAHKVASFELVDIPLVKKIARTGKPLIISTGMATFEEIEEASSRVFRRSLFVVQDVKQGQLLSDQNIRSIRPAHGLHTRHLPQVLGKRASRDIEQGTPLSWDLVEK